MIIIIKKIKKNSENDWSFCIYKIDLQYPVYYVSDKYVQTRTYNSYVYSTVYYNKNKCVCMCANIRLPVYISVNRIQIHIIVHWCDLCSLYRVYHTIILVTIIINSLLFRDMPSKLRLKNYIIIPWTYKSMWYHSFFFSLEESGELLILLRWYNIGDSYKVRYGLFWCNCLKNKVIEAKI